MTDIEALLAEINTPLIPELAAAVIETDSLGEWIKHPFYNGPNTFHVQANKAYEIKTKLVAERLAAADFAGLVWVYERPWRPQALLAHADLIEADIDYWQLVADVWIDTELPWQARDEWEALLLSERPERSAMMQPEDHEVWNHFTAEPVKIYRGISQGWSIDDAIEMDGFSWTTHLPTAQWFAKRFAGASGCPYIIHGEVMRDDVLAYFARRSEHEVLVHSDNVNVTMIERYSDD